MDSGKHRHRVVGSEFRVAERLQHIQLFACLLARCQRFRRRSKRPQCPPATEQGLYAGPTPAEPKVFLPPSFLSSNGSANPSLIAPPTTPGQPGQFVFLSGPMFFNTDVSLVKSIPIEERVRFKIYAEFLNAFNHTNWNVIDGYAGGSNNPAEYANINSSSFSALSDPCTPRNIQFRLQVAF